MNEPTDEATGVGFTPQERKVLNSLADAWNAFVSLKGIPQDDLDDFRKSIHDAQRIIASRIAGRADTTTWRS